LGFVANHRVPFVHVEQKLVVRADSRVCCEEVAYYSVRHDGWTVDFGIDEVTPMIAEDQNLRKWHWYILYSRSQELGIR